MRVTASTDVPDGAIARWLLTEWAFRPRWAITASVGVSHQLPELRQVLGDAGAPEPRAERARHMDVAIEQRLAGGVRWQATLFGRAERDILREPDIHPRLVSDVMVAPERRYLHALKGWSHGFELLVDRPSPTGLSAWASYSFGETRYSDIERRESFWGDFDQRHAVTLFGHFRFSAQTSVGATFRGGSNFTIPGYLSVGPHGLAAGAARNRVRLPPYARLDVRADRRFERFGRRVTIFAEAMNVLNRANAGLAGGQIDTDTGEATGFTDGLFRRRVSAGLLVDF
jgi:hypothetical protein